VFDEIDRAYYERRSKEELEKAESADDPAVKHVHLSLSADYAQKAKALVDETSFAFEIKSCRTAS
jgi:hypothetical protein